MGTTRWVFGLAGGSLGQLKGSEGQLEESGEQLEGLEAQLEGSEAQLDGFDSQPRGGRIDGQMDGKSPYSTGFCPLSRPLPKKGWKNILFIKTLLRKT